MKRQYLFLVILLGMASACRKETIETAKPQDEPFPYIRVGNLWVYDFVYDGKVVDSLSREITGKDSSEIYSGLTKDSHTTQEEFYIKQGSELLYYTKGQQPSQSVVLAKAHPGLSETWVKWDGTDSFRMTVIKTGYEVKTPAGNFICYSLREENLRTKYVTSYDINPSCGLVRIEMTYQGKAISYVLRRKNF